MGVEAQQAFTRAETRQHFIEASDFGFNDPQYNDFEALAAYMRRFGLTLRYGDGCPVQEPAPPD